MTPALTISREALRAARSERARASVAFSLVILVERKLTEQCRGYRIGPVPLLRLWQEGPLDHSPECIGRTFRGTRAANDGIFGGPSCGAKALLPFRTISPEVRP
jgi:hypothetical protein